MKNKVVVITGGNSGTILDSYTSGTIVTSGSGDEHNMVLASGFAGYDVAINEQGWGVFYCDGFVSFGRECCMRSLTSVSLALLKRSREPTR